MEPIVNRVAESELIVFNLDDLWDGRDVEDLDLAQFLFQGLVLREKEFRAAVAAFDWSRYRDRHVAISCSTDAIVPIWAFMLIASRLDGIAAGVSQGASEQAIRDHFVQELERFDWERYRDSIVVVKGCGSKVVPLQAYVSAVGRLQNVARKVMFGEPCSSVPLWRRPAATPDTRASGGAPPRPNRRT